MRASNILSYISCLSLLPYSAIGAAIDSQRQLNSVDETLSESKIDPKVAASIEDGPKAGATNSEAVSDNSTTFNGISVPPMKELEGETMDEDISHGYWFIKHYSPYCGHCKTAAPIWQTLYEFYYTSKPVPGKSTEAVDADSLNGFTRYYDFHFASLNCIAYGDACNQHDVNAFPLFSVYKDGEFVSKFEGMKNLAPMSTFVEGVLETIKPGSRPLDGLVLPEVGADSVPAGPAAKSVDGAAVAAPLAAAAPLEKTKADTAKLKDEPVKIKDDATKAKEEALEDESPVILEDPSETALDKPSGSKKPKVLPPANPNGQSFDLSLEEFQKLVINTQDPWFIKFYAPWCHHCQALAPSWRQMAKEMQNDLNIGEVNCDKESRLCKEANVKAYPTMFYFRGGERVEYQGLRGLGDLVSYARKAIDLGSGVRYVNETAFKEMEQTEEVIFVYFFDHATTTEDFEALERLTLSLVGKAKLVKTDDKALAERFEISTWPRLLVSRDGRASYYEVLAPKDMRDYRQVLAWMQTVWLPLVPELTADNAKAIMKGKYVVMAVLSRDRSDEFILSRRELKQAGLDWMEKQSLAFKLERQELRDAKQLRLEEAEDRNDERAKRAAKSIHIDIREDDKKQVGFAWVDGVFWERWIKTTYGMSVRDGERVIIVDEDNHRYWDNTISGAPIVPSRTSILETIPKVIAIPPKISPKSSTGAIQRLFFGFRGLSASHPWLSTGVLIGVFVCVYMWTRGRLGGASGGGGGYQSLGNGGAKRKGGGFFYLDGKEGLLNGGNVEKAE